MMSETIKDYVSVFIQSSILIEMTHLNGVWIGKSSVADCHGLLYRKYHHTSFP